MQKLNVAHLITGLHMGGAEMMLYKLLQHLDQQQFNTQVISLIPLGVVAKQIEQLGISVTTLGMRKGIPNPYYILKLAKQLKQDNVQLLQTWIYQADLIGAFAAKLAGQIPTIWGIHNCKPDRSNSRITARMSAKLCAHWSVRLPEKIICCAEQAKQDHINMGYAAEKFTLIANGFDTNQFKPNATARVNIRNELNLNQDDCLVGLFGRFDPNKDHTNFIQSATLVAQQCPNVHFILCGKHITRDNKSLNQLIENTGISNQFHLLGLRQDIPDLMAALDVYASSSYSEAFANVIGEAMSTAIPCVVTNVGDSAKLVADTGIIVPRQNPTELAQGIIKLLQLPPNQRQQLGNQARQHIIQHYDMKQIVKQYCSLYQLINQHGHN